MELTKGEKFVVLVMRLLTASFAAVGLVFLLAPDGTISFLDGVGSSLGKFSQGSPAGQRFWLGLGFSYMVVVTAIAFLAQSDIRKNYRMLPVLAIGKTASSLTTLYFFFLDKVFADLLNFLVDGSLAILVLVCYSVAKKAGGAAEKR